MDFKLQQLVEYVENNEVAWKSCDSLVEFSYADGHEISEEDRVEYDQRNNNMLNILCNAKEYHIFNHEIEDCSGFEDLIEWTSADDLLILVDNQLLLCIAPCNKEMVLKMVA